MEPVEKFDVMTEIWKVIVEALRKQAFSVMLLLAGCGGLWHMMMQVKAEATQTKQEYKQEIASLRVEIHDCDKERTSLSEELGRLRERVNILMSRK